MTATLAAKTAALLLAGRVTVLIADDAGLVIADVEGDTLPHRVTAGRGGWACTCQAAAHHRRCSHVTAVQLVVDHACRDDAVEAVRPVSEAPPHPLAGDPYVLRSFSPHSDLTESDELGAAS